MERIGQVNQYIEIDPTPDLGPAPSKGRVMGAALGAMLRDFKRKKQEVFFTVNLANGVTPFIMFFNGKQCASHAYRLTEPAATVAAAYYRPSPPEFDGLDEQVRDHVLNGGLIPEKLHVAVARQLPLDPISPDMSWEAMQDAFQTIYQTRIRPQVKGK